MNRQLKEAVSRIRYQLEKRETQNANQIGAALTQTKQVVSVEIQPVLDGIAEKQKSGGKVPLSWLYEGNKLERIKQAVSREVNRFGEFVRGIIEGTTLWASRLGSQAAAAFYAAMAPEQATLLSLGAEQLATLAGRTTDKLVSALSGLSELTAEEVERSLVRGVSQGTPASKIGEEVTQKLELPRTRALALSATLPTQALRETTIETYRAQGEERITEWLWVCQLSRSSCMACVAMHGTLHPLSEKLHDHPHGKCMAVPYSPDMTLFRSGAAWFARQSEKVQRSILGSKVAYQLYLEGKDIQDFVGEKQNQEGNTFIYQKSVKQILQEK